MPLRPLNRNLVKGFRSQWWLLWRSKVMITVGNISKSQVNELHRDSDEHKEKTCHPLDDILALDPAHRPKALLKIMCHPENDVNELWPIVGKIWREANGGKVRVPD